MKVESYANKFKLSRRNFYLCKKGDCSHRIIKIKMDLRSKK